MTGHFNLFILLLFMTKNGKWVTTVSAILKFGFQKKQRKKKTFCKRKLSELHKIDSILPVTFTILIKQRETKHTMDISVPLSQINLLKACSILETNMN